MRDHKKQKIAIVVGSIPTIEEIDQFALVKDQFEVTLISSESICKYVSGLSRFDALLYCSLPDYDDNPSYMPGLERALSGFDIVVLKERIGLYAYQTVKAKWQHRFKLMVWIDNLAIFPGNDLDQMRTIRNEIVRNADGFMVQTKAAEQVLLLEGIKSTKIQLMKPWVETRAKRTPKHRAQALENLNLTESNLLISYFGQIEWEEGLCDLLLAVKLAIDSDAALQRRLHIALCGTGSFIAGLSDVATELGLQDRVSLINPGRITTSVLYEATDVLFLGSTASRDRVEGEAHRLIVPMINRIPILASRSPMVEEFCGKHRFDFCAKSPDSLMRAMKKSLTPSAIRSDIVKKNYDAATHLCKQEEVIDSMLNTFNNIRADESFVSSSGYEAKVVEAELLVKNEKFVDAVDAIEHLFKNKDLPQYHRANLNRMIGDCFLKLGDPESAKEAYNTSLSLDPFSFKTLVGLGTMHLLKNSFDISISHFQKAVALAPNDENTNLGLGLSFEGLNESKEAMNWILKSLECNPFNLSAIFTLVKVAHKIEKFEDAAKVLKNYVHSHPTDTNILYSLGGLYFKMHDYERASSCMKDILKIDHDDVKAITLLEHIHNAVNVVAKVSSRE